MAGGEQCAEAVRRRLRNEGQQGGAAPQGEPLALVRAIQEELVNVAAQAAQLYDRLEVVKQTLSDERLSQELKRWRKKRPAQPRRRRAKESTHG